MVPDDERVARLREALHSTNHHERAVAAVELGARAARSALPDIEALRDDPEDLVAVAATIACWRMGVEPPSLDRVTRALASDDEETMQAAVIGLSSLGDAVLEPLSASLRAGGPARKQIVRLLGDIGTERALDVARSLAESDDAELADAARDVIEDWDD